MSCGSIWRCFCEQRNEPESKNPQHRKTEKYPCPGHSTELYVRESVKGDGKTDRNTVQYFKK